VNDVVTLNAFIPFIYATREENGVPDSSIRGLGDIALNVLWSPFDKGHHLNGLSFTTGVIFPTGDTSSQPVEGILAPNVFQLGTGAYQLTLGSNYRWSIDDWNFNVGLNFTLPINESDLGFEPASSFSSKISAGRSITEDLHFNLGLNYLDSDDDQLNGEDLVTGYQALSLDVGIVWRLNEELSLSSSASIPLYRKVNQTQIATGPQFQVGLSYSF